MDNELRETLGLILTKFDGLQQEVGSLKEGQLKLEKGQHEIKLKLENNIEPKIQLIYEVQGDVIKRYEQLDKLEDKIEEVSTDVFALKVAAVKQLQSAK